MMRWNSALNRSIPTRIKHLIRRSNLYVRHRSANTNVYHCCIHKSGSQWIRKILSDSRTYKYSGLTTYNYQKNLPGRHDPRKIIDRAFWEPFRLNTIVTPLYITFENFLTIPKPKRYRAFFVMRDPRDLVVSSYFSIRYSHSPMGEIPEIRETLNGMPLAEGILYTIRRWRDRGHFSALRSWVESSKKDEKVLLVKFEDLTGPESFEFFRELFSHCDILMPQDILNQLVQDYSFERLSEREKGNEDKSAHYRKGVPGDWKNYFDDMITAEFQGTVGDLVTKLGYEKNVDWWAVG